MNPAISLLGTTALLFEAPGPCELASQQRIWALARAAEIKAGIGLPARIDDRVEEVVANAGRHAASHGLDRALIEAIWRQLVEAAIAQEDRHLNGDRP